MLAIFTLSCIGFVYIFHCVPTTRTNNEKERITFIFSVLDDNVMHVYGFSHECVVAATAVKVNGEIGSRQGTSHALLITFVHEPNKKCFDSHFST